jgi:hypothetical protein
LRGGGVDHLRKGAAHALLAGRRAVQTVPCHEVRHAGIGRTLQESEVREMSSLLLACDLGDYPLDVLVTMSL